MQTIQLTLTVEEVNQILNALGEQPYAKVYTLVNKIQEQAQAQLQAHESPMAQENIPPEKEAQRSEKNE